MKTFTTKNMQQTFRAFYAACSPQQVMNPPVLSHLSQIHHILYLQPIQTNVTNGAPNDKYEQEADRVAEQVMRMPERTIQRKPT